MNGDEASFPRHDLDDEPERSSVTLLMPVAVKPARYRDLEEGDCTQYFSVKELMDRGKALAARADEPPPATTPTLLPAAPASQNGDWRQQLREATLPRKLSAVLLVLVVGMVAIKPVFKKPAPATYEPAAVAQSVKPPVVAPPALAAARDSPPPPPAVAAPVTLPRGTTPERAAVDSLAAGDFARALALYRELGQREPNNLAYREATRILEERVRVRAP